MMDPTEAMAARSDFKPARNEMQIGPVPPREPRWRKEIRLLRRDGPVKYVQVLRSLRRFHRSLKRARREEERGRA